MKNLLKILLILILISSITTAGYAQITYAPAQELGRIQDPLLTEISGVASSYNTPGAFWVHNDSGDGPRIFLVDKSGNTLTKGTISNASANDWEDIASFQLNGKSYLIIADIGDNAQSRTQYTLYIIEEPQYNPGGSNPTSYPILRRINFTYSTGPQNCESIGVDVQSGKILFVSKTNWEGSLKIRYVHELPLSVASGTVTQVAQKIQEFGSIYEATTAMDISNDGRRATVLTVLDGAFEFTRSATGTWAQAFSTTPRRVAVPEGRGNEAICYDINGVDLYSMKEGSSSPIWFYKGTVPVTGVSLTPSTATISVGNTQQLTATVAPSNATNITVTWSSSNTAVATVNASGLVTAVGPGTATITVTTQDGGKTDTSAITVTTAPAGSQTYQAENAAYSGAVVATNQPGYHGTGFIDFVNNTGDYVQWTVNAPSAGKYDLSFRYALPNGGRPLELKVNGTVKDASFDFPATTSWDNWQYVTSTQTLNAGNNTIRLTTNGSNGGNIDELSVIPYLDDCDALAGWTSASANTLTYYTADKKQGAGCLQMVGSATDEFKRSFSAPLNSGVSIANGVLSFWYYVSDVTKCGTVRVELGSGGAADINELGWPLSGLVNGWNHITLNTSDAVQTGGSTNMAALNWFRIYNPKTGSITTRLDAIRILESPSMSGSQLASGPPANSFDLQSPSESKSVIIYPNPYKEGILSIDLPGFETSKKVKIKIMNVAGQSIYESTLENSSHLNLNLSGKLKEAIYLIYIEADNTRIVRKLVVN